MNRRSLVIPVVLAVSLAFPSPVIRAQGASGVSEQGGLSAASVEKLLDQNSVDQKISLDLKGIDINEFLRVLSVKMGVTIVPTRSVSGRINIYLNNLSYEDALDVVMFSQDLAYEKKGRIINVMTTAEYERAYGKKFNEKRMVRFFKLAYTKPQVVFEALGQLKSDIGKIVVDENTGSLFVIDIPEKMPLIAETIARLDKPLQVEIFELQYSNPADVKALLSGALTPGVGEIYVDERSHKLVVSDLPERMDKVRSMVRAFDEPTRQVFIEGEIVQVTLKKEYLRGINWSKIMGASLDNAKVEGTFPLASSFTPSPNLGTDQLKVTVGSLEADKYTAAIQFLETLGDTKVLSQPRISVTNNQEANIMVGSREAYVTQSLSQGDSTTVTSENIQFTDVGVKLKVEPSISKDRYVVLKIKPEVSSVREIITTALGSRIPIVETSEASTVVKVKDGTMIMIAGLMKEDKREDTTGIPVLSRLPVLGGAFGAKGKQRKKTELIIFITPRIIPGDVPIKGLETDDIVPPDIASTQTRERLIEDGLDQVRQTAPARGPEGFDGRTTRVPPEAQEVESEEMDIRMKGIRSF